MENNSTNNITEEEAQQELSEILQIRRDKLKALQDAGNDPFEKTKFSRTAFTKDITDNFESTEGSEVSLAGRIMAKRGMGKAIFADITDDKGRIQLYIKQSELSEESFAEVRKYDIGDIIGVSGKVFKTKMGEISIHCTEVELL